MDESQILFLIAEGESAKVEFKRELDLSSARGKAEFVKDIIALANSASDVSYMLVGVDNSKLVVGIKTLAEEQMQQIALTYITPSIDLAFRIVPVNAPGLPSVGLIEIRPTTKPHRATRTLEQVLQNKVFIRHGTIVTEASPDEINLMYRESSWGNDIRQYIRAAETHMRLGNFDSATVAYSRALEYMPTAELFLARGKAYKAISTIVVDDDSPESVELRRKKRALAFKDFSSAVSIASTPEQERESRWERWQVFGSNFLPPEESEVFSRQEFEWLRANLTGPNLGQLFYWDFIDGWRTESDYEDKSGKTLLNQVLALGYKESEVYELRATIHYSECNYGLALEDVNIAIATSKPHTKKMAGYFATRAKIYFKMGGYQYHSNSYFTQAYKDLIQARLLLNDTTVPGFGYQDADLEMEIFYRLVLNYEFGHMKNENKEFQKNLIQRLALAWGGIRTTFPDMVSIVWKIVGNEFWQKNRSHLE